MDTEGFNEIMGKRQEKMSGLEATTHNENTSEDITKEKTFLNNSLNENTPMTYERLSELGVPVYIENTGEVYIPKDPLTEEEKNLVDQSRLDRINFF